MQNVATDPPDEPLDSPLVATNGQRIEQRLGRMFVGAISSIDNRTVDLLSKQLDGSRSVMAVSIKVSPLRMAEDPTDMFITSAPRRLPASSNEDWVRVDDSKNRLIWVRPRNEER